MRTSIETESPPLCSVVYLYISGECNTGVIYLSRPCYVNTFSCFKLLPAFLFSTWRNDGAGREKSVVEEINWFSLFDCVGIKTQSCSPSARLRLTACTMGNTFSSQQDSEEKNRRNGKEDE